jgi:hypothetical protein
MTLIDIVPLHAAAVSHTEINTEHKSIVGAHIDDTVKIIIQAQAAWSGINLYKTRFFISMIVLEV